MQFPVVHASRTRPSFGFRPFFQSLAGVAFLALVCLGLLAPSSRPAVAAGEAAAASPTGRAPRLLWSPRQQAVWNRMRAENHPVWQLLKRYADKTGTANAAYGDFGQWAAVAYQITGDPAYAQKAWTQINTGNGGGSFLGVASVPTNSTNFTRENFMDFVWLYDWLYPSLSSAQRTLFLNTLNYWADTCVGAAPIYTKPDGSPVVWPPRLDDSDNTTGHYFGMAFLDLATGPDNPRAGSFLSQKGVGGLDANGSNLTTTMRNAIKKYAEEARGGVWIESSQYNLGTLRLLIQGAAGVRAATGVDYFPEVTALEAQVGQEMMQDLTPDLQQCYQWGDVEDRRSAHVLRRLTLDGVLVGLLQDNPAVGPYVHQALEDVAAAHPSDTYRWHQFFLFYNPYAPKGDWRSEQPKGFYAPGQGVMFFHNGRDAGDTLFGAHMTARTHVDHENAYFGDFQLYRHGEWALTHPIGYGTNLGDFTNSMLIAGLSSACEVRGPVAQEFGADDEYAYLSGTTAGQCYEAGYWNAPAPFLQEWTRSTFYLPSSDKRSDTVIVFDRVNAQNPKSLPNFARYRKVEQDRINAAPALKQWLIHSPVSPSVTDGAVSWTSPGGQQVRVNTLLPAGAKRQVVDERSLWPATYGYPVQDERKWLTRIMPAGEQQWDTFLNVVQVSESGTALQNTLVRSAQGEAQGVVTQRGGQGDVLVMFGARQAARLLSQGYSVSWDASAPRTDAYLLDLDPKADWKVSLDGKAAVTLSVSDQGVGRVSLSGAGAHSLRLIAGGVPVGDTAAPAVPTALSVTAGNARATAAWSANREADLAGYYLYRGETATGTFARQNGTPLPVTSLTQTALTNGKTYWYKVSAVDASGNESAATAPAAGTPAAVPAPPPPPPGPVPPATFSISGRVTAGGNGLAGVTLAAGAQTAETAGDGSYSFSGLSAGSYTVTASKSGYTLSAAQTVSVGPDKTGINFTAAPVPVQPAATFSISGTVRVDGKALAGATVTVPGKGSLSTGPDGGYRFTDLPAGSYTVTAEAPNCSFSPRAVTVGPDQAGVDFSNRARYSIGGKVLIRKKGVAGVTVMVVGTDRTLLTAAGGVYAFGGLSAGTYTVTAKKGKRVFPKRVVRIGPSQTRVMLALKK